MHRPKIGCYAVYEPPEEGWQNWEEQFAQVTGELQALGLDVAAAPEAVKDPGSAERVAAWLVGQDVDLLHALIVTWSFDHYTVEIQQQTRVPVAVRAIPGIRTGSIVGTQQLGSVLADLEVPYRLYYGPIGSHFGPPGSQPVAQEVATFARACSIQNRLRGARIGVVGRRTEGMTPTAVDEVEILRLFGTRLLHYGLDEILELAEKVDREEAQAVWQGMQAGAVSVTSRTEHGVRTARNYLALKRLAAEAGLDALTIGSYPKCQGTMCVPIAWLNEEGLPTGCEGDVNSTLCMLILSMLSPDPVHFGEMLAVDEEENSLVTSHCGCGSPSLASQSGYILCPVRLANDGVSIRYTARPGPITFANLVGRKGNYRMCAVEGKAIPTELVFEGNPLKFILKTPFRKLWAQIAAHGFGHHWMATYAHVAPVLAEFCRLRGMKGVFPDLEAGT